MKYRIFFCCLLVTGIARAQDNKSYPTPEFVNEIYLLTKDSMKLVKLEKQNAALETKTKLGGLAGAEVGYFLEGTRSKVRFSSGEGLSFTYYLAPPGGNSATADSVMRANGLDPSMMSMQSRQDPSNTVKLYQAIVQKEKRKLEFQQQPAARGFGKAKKEGGKPAFSLREIKPGYYEFVIDKTLSKGEYAFAIMDPTNPYAATVFAFAID